MVAVAMAAVAVAVAAAVAVVKNTCISCFGGLLFYQRNHTL